jgi:hypothetical protein
MISLSNQKQKKKEITIQEKQSPREFRKERKLKRRISIPRQRNKKFTQQGTQLTQRPGFVDLHYSLRPRRRSPHPPAHQLRLLPPPRGRRIFPTARAPNR